MKKEILQYIKSLLLNRKVEDNNVINTIQKLLNQTNFYEDLLEYSSNDINAFCYHLGIIISYYITTRDTKYNYATEEILNKNFTLEINNKTIENNVINNGFFTHSCNGHMLQMIMNNGLGSPNNFDKELFNSLNYLEKILHTGYYTNQQSGRVDEVYFTSPGASSVGYACLFSPERLFLGILEQSRENSIPIIVGENKKDYYRKVLYSKIENLTEEIKKHIEIVLDGYFNEQNGIIFFPISKIVKSKNIYFETLSNHIENLKEYIERNCISILDFFTQAIGSNSNSNNMDNLIIINEIIPSEYLKYIQIPDRYDLIQLISRNRNLQNGDEIDYFTGEQIKNKIKLN